MTNLTQDLFLLVVNISQYKSKGLIIKVFVESLNAIFAPHTFEWYAENTENSDALFEVCTRSKQYGYIKNSKGETLSDETFSLLQNAVQMLALSLENLEKEELLNDQKEHLKQLVDKQTYDLLQKQAELITQNEEYEALNEELRQTNEELYQLNEALQSAKEESERSENKLKEAQSLAHIGSWELDLVTNTLTWSDEIFKIFGCNPCEFGATYEAFLNFIHPEDREFVNNSYLKHIKTKVPYNIVHRILLSGNEIKYVNERCKSEFDAQGKPIRSVGTVADITEKIKSEEILHRTQYSIDNIADSIFWIDKSARFIFANQAACRNLEYSIDELLALTVFDIDPEFLQDNWEEHWNTIFLKDSFTIETVHCTKTGQRYPVEVTTNKVEFGGVMFNCAIARDISERKKAEEKIRKINIELEQRVAKRTLQLEAANKELETFAYSVSHDLRAPLRSIGGFSQILLEEYLHKLDAQGQDYLSRVHNGAQHMSELIDDMLTLSKVTRSEMNIREFNLSIIVHEIANELNNSDKKRKVECIIQDNVFADADERLIRIALENLLDNAWKFTSKKPVARIEFGMMKKEGSNSYFIRDNGAGFDMKYAQKLFGAFQRLHDVSDFPGTGIGLATVQRIINRHGGKVWAEGEVGKGATLYFTLPLYYILEEYNHENKYII